MTASRWIRTAALAAGFSLVLAGATYAQQPDAQKSAGQQHKDKKSDGKQGGHDLGKANGTVGNITQAQPPQASTTTKKSAAGEPRSNFRPKQKSPKVKEPPPPAKPKQK